MNKLHRTVRQNSQSLLLGLLALGSIVTLSFGDIPYSIYAEEHSMSKPVEDSARESLKNKLHVTMNLCTGMATYGFLKMPYEKNYVSSDDPFRLYEDPLQRSPHTNDVRKNCAQFIREYIVLNQSNEQKLSEMSDEILTKTAAILDDLSQAEAQKA